MNRKTALIAGLLVFFVIQALAQNYIYISHSGIRKYLRVNMGYSYWNLKPDNAFNKSANGLHLLNELKILSAAWNKTHSVTFHDAFYFDISMGPMNQEPRERMDNDGKINKEARFSVSWNAGYLLLAGYRSIKWAALAGMDYRIQAASFGELLNSSTSDNSLLVLRPAVFRAEYCISKAVADQRIIGMLWVEPRINDSNKYFSARIEYPLSEQARWFIFGQYTHFKCGATDYWVDESIHTASFNQFMIGFRIQNPIL